MRKILLSLSGLLAVALLLGGGNALAKTGVGSSTSTPSRQGVNKAKPVDKANQVKATKQSTTTPKKKPDTKPGKKPTSTR